MQVEIRVSGADTAQNIERYVMKRVNDELDEYSEVIHRVHVDFVESMDGGGRQHFQCRMQVILCNHSSAKTVRRGPYFPATVDAAVQAVGIWVDSCLRRAAARVDTVMLRPSL